MLSLNQLTLMVILSELIKVNSIPNCEKEWHGFDEKCYKFFHSNQYFSTANKLCKRYNSELVSIKNKEENEFICQLIQNHTNDDSFEEAWIGYKAEKEQQYYWIDNSKLAYSNWMINKPIKNEQACAIIIPGGKWVDITCYHLRPFICEKDPNPVVKEDNTSFILMLTIPLCCLFIMFLFVVFLCIRSHDELNELRKEIPEEVKPFELVQATMTLPIQKTPDLLSKRNGKSLWHNAIERIRHEQNNNNPVKVSNSYPQGGNSANDVNKATKNPENRFYDLVNEVVTKKRRESRAHGLIGMNGFTLTESQNSNPTKKNFASLVKEIMQNRQRSNSNLSQKNNMDSGSNSLQIPSKEPVVITNESIPAMYHDDFYFKRKVGNDNMQSEDLNSESSYVQRPKYTNHNGTIFKSLSFEETSSVIENKVAIKYIKSEPWQYSPIYKNKQPQNSARFPEENDKPKNEFTQSLKNDQPIKDSNSDLFSIYNPEKLDYIPFPNSAFFETSRMKDEFYTEELIKTRTDRNKYFENNSNHIVSNNQSDFHAQETNHVNRNRTIEVTYL